MKRLSPSDQIKLKNMVGEDTTFLSVIGSLVTIAEKNDEREVADCLDDTYHELKRLAEYDGGAEDDDDDSDDSDEDDEPEEE